MATINVQQLNDDVVRRLAANGEEMHAPRLMAQSFPGYRKIRQMFVPGTDAEYRAVHGNRLFPCSGGRSSQRESASKIVCLRQQFCFCQMIHGDEDPIVNRLANIPGSPLVNERIPIFVLQFLIQFPGRKSICKFSCFCFLSMRMLWILEFDKQYSIRFLGNEIHGFHAMR